MKRKAEAPHKFEIQAELSVAQAPTLRQIRDAVVKVIDKLGGQKGISDKFSRSEERRVGKECRL